MAINYFKWDTEFETGIEIIDQQHYKLVQIINDLLELSLDAIAPSTEKLDSLLRELKTYVDVHFSSEETMMAQFQVDDRHVQEHLQLHKWFIDQVESDFISQLNEVSSETVNHFVEYLIRWLAYHILNTDKSLVRQLNAIIKDGKTANEAYDEDQLHNESTKEPLLKALQVLYRLVLDKNNEIERKNQELERKILERTKALQEANNRLHEMVYVDDLTKLKNRKYVMETLDHHIYNFERYGTPSSLLFIDVDGFKQVNDQYGHDAGDEVLRWIAHQLQTCTRKTDIACRLGGDEFVLICTNTSEQQVLTVVNNLTTLCLNQQHSCPITWKPSISIGVATINAEVHTASDLLKRADTAMYQAKSKGGNQMIAYKNPTQA